MGRESLSRGTKTRTSKRLAQRKPAIKNPEAEERGVNTSGLACLPDELLLEIVSYLPSLPAPSEYHTHRDGHEYVQHRDLLLGLSRMCQNLRRFFRPYVWSRLEVTSGMQIGNTLLRRRSGKQTETAYATEVIRQLEIVTIRDPSLAEYVQIVNFEITDFSLNSVLIELGRCFSMFPNLHTVKLDMHTSYRSWDMVTVNGFEKYTYPSIRSVILCLRTYPLLLSCPNVKTVRCMEMTYGGGVELMKYLSKSPSIESVGCEFLLTDLEAASKTFPNLRQIKIRCNLPYYLTTDEADSQIKGTTKNLCLMKHLQDVTLDIPQDCSIYAREIITKNVSQQVQILHEQNGGRKRIDVFNISPSPYFLLARILYQTINFPPLVTPT